MNLRQSFVDSLLPSYLGLCLIFGGAASAGVVANALLELLAILILLAALLQNRQSDEPSQKLNTAERGLALMTVLAVCLPLLQLIPLPASLWQILPGRSEIAAGDQLIGMTGVQRSLSFQPGATIASLLGLLPPVAILALTLRASEQARRASIATILVVAVLSSAIGVIQLSQGVGGSAYFYRITNDNTSVGFFANSNHLATLFLIATVFAADLPFQRSQQDAAPMWRISRIVVLSFFLINLALNRSLAGYILVLPIIAFWLLRARFAKSWLQRINVPMPAIFGLMLTVGLIIALLAHNRLRQMTTDMTDPQERLLYYRNTLYMIRHTFPFGTGLGTFRWSYPGIENFNAVTSTYVNHAHNDYLEVMSDLGLGGLILLGGFFAWYIYQLRQLASLDLAPPAYVLDAAMALAVIAAHSAVDYPARTAAIGGIAAMCMGMIARYPLLLKVKSQSRQHRSSAQKTPASLNADR